MSEANRAQAAFWNEDPGRNWVTFQPDLDHLHAEISDRLIAAAAPAPGEAVLDIGCGAGATSLAAAVAVETAGRVLGADISEPLLDRARARAAAAGLNGRVRFVLADAEDAPLGRGEFDLAISRFGVMFFADPVAAFGNIRRALRPGGRLVAAAWADPEANPFFAWARAAAEARLGPGAAADPAAPGPMALRDPVRTCSLLEAAGFADPQAEPVDLALGHPGGLAALLPILARIGPVAGLLREKGGDEADRDAILADLGSRFAKFETAEGLRIPARVWFYRGRA